MLELVIWIIILLWLGMQCFLAATQTKDVKAYVESLLRETSAFGRGVFDFLLEADSSAITRIVAHLRCDEESLWKLCGSTFTHTFLKWTLYGGEAPLARYHNERVIIGGVSSGVAPTTEIILSEGDELSVAELLVKHYLQHGRIVLCGQMESFDKRAVTDQLHRFDVLHDSRIIPVMPESIFVRADIEEIARLLYSVLNSEYVEEIFQLADGHFELNIRCIQPETLWFSQYMSDILARLVSTKADVAGIITEVKRLSEECTTSYIYNAVQDSAYVLTILLENNANFFIFDKESLSLVNIEVNVRIASEIKKECPELRNKLLNAFLYSDITPEFIGITSAQNIAMLAAKYSDLICIPELVYWRALEDGPEFILELLSALSASEIVEAIQIRTLISIFSVAQRLPWVYGENDVAGETRILLAELNASALIRLNIDLFKASVMEPQRYLNKAVQLMASPLVNMLTDVVFDIEAAVDAIMSPIIPRIEFDDVGFPLFRPSYSGYLILLYVIHACSSKLIDQATPPLAKARMATFLSFLCSKYGITLSLSPRRLLAIDHSDFGVFAFCLYALHHFFGTLDGVILEERACEERKRSLGEKAIKLRTTLDAAPTMVINSVTFIAEQRLLEEENMMQTEEELNRSSMLCGRVDKEEIVDLRSELAKSNKEMEELDLEATELSPAAERYLEDADELVKLSREHKCAIKDSRDLALTAQLCKESLERLFNAPALRGCAFLREYLSSCTNYPPSISPQFDPERFRRCLLEGFGWNHSRKIARKITTEQANIENETIEEALLRGIIQEFNCEFYQDHGGLNQANREEIMHRLQTIGDSLGFIWATKNLFPSARELDIIFVMMYAFFHENNYVFQLFSAFLISMIRRYMTIKTVNTVPLLLETLLYNYSIVLGIIDHSFQHVHADHKKLVHNFDQLRNILIMPKYDTDDYETPNPQLVSALLEYLPSRIIASISNERRKSHLLKIIRYFKFYEEHFHGSKELKHALSNICSGAPSEGIGPSLFEVLGYEAAQLEILWDHVHRKLDDMEQKALSHAALGVINDELQCYRNCNVLTERELRQMEIKLSWLD